MNEFDDCDNSLDREEGGVKVLELKSSLPANPLRFVLRDDSTNLRILLHLLECVMMIKFNVISIKENEGMLTLWDGFFMANVIDIYHIYILMCLHPHLGNEEIASDDLDNSVVSKNSGEKPRPESGWEVSEE